jgi:hypothetical protein
MNTLLDWRSKLQRWCFSWYAPLVIKGIISKPELVPYEDISRWKGVTFKEGLPYVSYKNGSSGYNPTTIALYGLMASTKFDPKSRAIVFKVAEWLVKNQKPDGSWTYDFEYESKQLGFKLEPGWKSAIAQGCSISLLIRAFNLFHDQRYLDAACRAVAVLFEPVESGGLQRTIDGMVFFEEYPVPHKGTYVLNGFLYAVIALYELASVHQHIKSLAYQSAKTGAAILERYAIPGTFYSRYALVGPVRRVNRRYQRTHIRLCVLLFLHSGMREYIRMAYHWSHSWRILIP